MTFRNIAPPHIRFVKGGGATSSLIYFLNMSDELNSNIDHGDDPAIRDLHDAEITVEIWFLSDGGGDNVDEHLIEKGQEPNYGWYLYFEDDNKLIRFEVACATTDARARTPNSSIANNTWYHIAAYFNDAGDRKPYIAINGTWAASYATQTAGVDAISSDGGYVLRLGDQIGGARHLSGKIGWYRISNNDRYNHTTNFTPAARDNPPNSDANTVLLVHVDEGEGTTLDNEQGDPNRDGTITNATWGSE